MSKYSSLEESRCAIAWNRETLQKDRCLIFDMFSNNSIEVNLLECTEKEKFNFEKIDGETSETDSAAGKVAAQLQEKTYKIFQRKR